MVDQQNAVSDCWKSFQYVQTSENHPVTVSGASAESMLVRCKFCGLIKNFKSRSGTKNLLEHHKACIKARNKDQIFGTVTGNELEQMTHSFVQFCAIDLRPYHSAKGEGLSNLLQTALDIQHSRGERLNAKDLTPDPSTISRHVPEHRKAIEDILKDMLILNSDQNRPAFSLDGWQDINGEVNIWLPQIRAANFIHLGSKVVTLGSKLIIFLGSKNYFFWAAKLFF